MEKVFSIDGKLFNFLNKCTDLVILNILWIICCIPIITIGASTTAMHYVTLKMAKGEESYIVKSFFHSFRQNLKQATMVWVCILASICILFFDFYYITHIKTNMTNLLTFAIFFITFLLGMMTCYVFPILSYFQCRTLKAMKNALSIAIIHLPYTVLLLLLESMPVVLILLFPTHLIPVTFFDIIIGFSLCAYLSAFIYNKIFKRYIPEEEECQ